jgi:hypothetical protein
LVSDRKQGPWRHYSLEQSRSSFQKRLIGCLDACLDEAPILRRDASKLSSLRKKACR